MCTSLQLHILGHSSTGSLATHTCPCMIVHYCRGGMESNHLVHRTNACTHAHTHTHTHNILCCLTGCCSHTVVVVGVVCGRSHQFQEASLSSSSVVHPPPPHLRTLMYQINAHFFLTLLYDRTFCDALNYVCTTSIHIE